MDSSSPSAHAASVLPSTPPLQTVAIVSEGERDSGPRIAPHPELLLALPFSTELHRSCPFRTYIFKHTECVLYVCVVVCWKQGFLLTADKLLCWCFKMDSGCVRVPYACVLRGTWTAHIWTMSHRFLPICLPPFRFLGSWIARHGSALSLFIFQCFYFFTRWIDGRSHEVNNPQNDPVRPISKIQHKGFCVTVCKRERRGSICIAPVVVYAAVFINYWLVWSQWEELAGLEG